MKKKIIGTMSFLFLMLGTMLFFINSRPVMAQGTGFDLTREKTIAMRYSPIIIQDSRSTADKFTEFNFDGDWNPLNNWQDLDVYSNPQPTIYYQVLETENYFFVYYFLFYPRNVENISIFHDYHENDLEAFFLAASKNAQLSNITSISLLEFEYHGSLNMYTNDSSLQSRCGYAKKPCACMQMNGSHPVIFSETGGHGLTMPTSLSYMSNYVLYYNCSENPSSVLGFGGQNMTYDLEPVYTTFWKYKQTITSYDPSLSTWNYLTRIELPIWIPGNDSYGPIKANFPWSFQFEDGCGLERGDWFFNPAKSMFQQWTGLGNFSMKYVYHPYFNEFGVSFDQTPVNASPGITALLLGCIFSVAILDAIELVKLKMKNRS
ncbi:MAG TPA: hypothetical protein VKM55_22245 [Candidatus Lokiarchaeia archaeon]|nr:hypothetical protein [Candidatus Lokiarchaeia archaeon]